VLLKALQKALLFEREYQARFDPDAAIKEGQVQDDPPDGSAGDPSKFASLAKVRVCACVCLRISGGAGSVCVGIYVVQCEGSFWWCCAPLLRPPTRVHSLYLYVTHSPPPQTNAHRTARRWRAKR
jgi:hypothetical protein